MEKIDKFEGDYFFLSNFYESPFTYEDKVWASVEHSYQAYKSNSEEIREIVRGMKKPYLAKRAGRAINPVREDWESVKYLLMFRMVLNKFLQNQEIADKLIATGDAELIEGNTWGDRYWGVCDGIGENRLGKVLMAVRQVLKQMEAMKK